MGSLHLSICSFLTIKASTWIYIIGSISVLYAILLLNASNYYHYTNMLLNHSALSGINGYALGYDSV